MINACMCVQEKKNGVTKKGVTKMWQITIIVTYEVYSNCQKNIYIAIIMMLFNARGP